MSGELQNSIHARHDYFSSLLQVVSGEPSGRLRSTLPDGDLNVVQQVDALLDQATDPQVLVRAYVGFQAYL